MDGRQQLLWQHVVMVVGIVDYGAFLCRRLGMWRPASILPVRLSVTWLTWWKSYNSAAVGHHQPLALFFLDHVHTVVLELDWWRHCEDLVIGEEHEVKSSSFIACTRCAAQFAIFSSWAWCFFRHFSQRSFSSCRKNKQLPLVEYNKIAAANSFAIFFCKKPGPWPTKWYK